MATDDPDKLFDLALQASHSNDKQKSISIIKDAIEKAPDDARMRYLLGSLYSDIGLYEKAVSNMQVALELNPDYAIARFHMGLLQLMSGDLDAAKATWEELDKLGEKHYLRLFKSGMMKIVEDDVEQGIGFIKAGIEHNQVNEALNSDMEVVLENVSLSQMDKIE